ncbi:hypothetical protein FKM82_006018 [Ascaphus truei]
MSVLHRSEIRAHFRIAVPDTVLLWTGHPTACRIGISLLNCAAQFIPALLTISGVLHIYIFVWRWDARYDFHTGCFSIPVRF